MTIADRPDMRTEGPFVIAARLHQRADALRGFDETILAAKRTCADIDQEEAALYRDVLTLPEVMEGKNAEIRRASAERVVSEIMRSRRRDTERLKAEADLERARIKFADEERRWKIDLALLRSFQAGD